MTKTEKAPAAAPAGKGRRESLTTRSARASATSLGAGAKREPAAPARHPDGYGGSGTSFWVNEVEAPSCLRCAWKP
jgi:hypothetical protein